MQMKVKPKNYECDYCGRQYYTPKGNCMDCGRRNKVVPIRNVKPKRGEFYRHYKGNVYIVLGHALHHHTEEEMVIYKSFKFNKVWVRPLDEFIDGRFRKEEIK